MVKVEIRAETISMIIMTDLMTQRRIMETVLTDSVAEESFM